MPKGYPEEPIEPAPCRSGILALQHEHLLAQGQNLQRQVLSGPKEGASPPQHAHDEAKHEPILQHHRSDQASRLSVQAVDFATEFIFGDAQPFRAPQANAYCERLIGTIRRECLDFLIPLNKRHLRGILKEWVVHYNRGRPHSSLGPGIPEPVAGFQRAEFPGHYLPSHQQVVAQAILGGLHHEYRLEKIAA